MKHTDYYSAYQALDKKERQELIAAVKAHGGQYVFINQGDESWFAKRFPIVIASSKYSEDYSNYNVSRITIDDNGNLNIYGFNRDYEGLDDEVELDYIAFGHIGDIIDFIPETGVVKDVSISSYNR